MYVRVYVTYIALSASSIGLLRVGSLPVIDGWPRKPWQDFQLRECLQLHIGRGRFQVLESPGSRNHPGIERPDGPVVGLERAFQCATELRQVPAEVRDALVQFAAFVRDLAGVERDALLLPDVRNGQEQREESAGSGQHDPARKSVLVKLRVGIQRRGEEAVAGQEEDGHLGTAIE